jgi:DNA-binding CsgD family transcriptional regulator
MAGPGNEQLPVRTDRKLRPAVHGVSANKARSPIKSGIKQAHRKAELAAKALGRSVWTSPTTSGHLGLIQARTIAESLGVIGLAAAVLNSDGELVATNRLFRALVPATVKHVQGPLRLVDAAADRLIREMMGRRSFLHSGVVRSFPVRPAQGKSPSIIRLFPIPSETDELFQGLTAVAVVSPAQPHAPPSLEILKGLFELSPAEARVAQGIAARWTVEEIADRSNVSRETVRSQLKTVLAKTGTKRQLDLAVMLLGLPIAKL